MNHIIQLYAQEIVTALTAIAVILMGANIGQAITAIVRKHDIADLDEANRSIVAELTEERVKREQAEAERDHAISMYRKCLEDVNTWKGEYVHAENESLKWQKTAKEVEADRDIARAEAMQFTADLNTLQSERATLYRRNAKGHFEAVVPQKPKPHTLRHGMTVKNPSAYQAKRIFSEAKRAGIRTYPWDNKVFREIHFSGLSVCGSKPGNPDATTYISAREFRRRIKGEIE